MSCRLAARVSFAARDLRSHPRLLTDACFWLVSVVRSDRTVWDRRASSAWNANAPVSLIDSTGRRCRTRAQMRTRDADRDRWIGAHGRQHRSPADEAWTRDGRI